MDYENKMYLYNDVVLAGIKCFLSRNISANAFGNE